MNTSAEIVLFFGDAEHLFALKGKQIEELQRVCGYHDKNGNLIPAGIGVIGQRMFAGNYLHQDIYHTLRLGLIGGGMSTWEASRLCEHYAGPPYAPSREQEADPAGPLKTATAVMEAVFFGVAEIKLAPEAGDPDSAEAGADPNEGEPNAGKDISTSRPSEQTSPAQE